MLSYIYIYVYVHMCMFPCMDKCQFFRCLILPRLMAKCLLCLLSTALADTGRWNTFDFDNIAFLVCAHSSPTHLAASLTWTLTSNKMWPSTAHLHSPRSPARKHCALDQIRSEQARALRMLQLLSEPVEGALSSSNTTVSAAVGPDCLIPHAVEPYSTVVHYRLVQAKMQV